jgi:type III restriction enzyme
LENYFRIEGTQPPGGPGVQAWLFPQALAVTRRWLKECVVCEDDTFPQLLLLTPLAHDAADRIFRAMVSTSAGEKRLRAVLHPVEPVGSSRGIDFDTGRDTWATRPDKCHVSHVALDSGWEASLVQALEETPEVIAYVKNQNLGFRIPFALDGRPGSYQPDFIIKLDTGEPGPHHLILDVTGEKKGDKAAQVAAARDLWVPAVNNEGGFGRWAFLEVMGRGDPRHWIGNCLQGSCL